MTFAVIRCLWLLLLGWDGERIVAHLREPAAPDSTTNAAGDLTTNQHPKSADQWLQIV